MQPFYTEGKALHATELKSGDIELRGYAAVWQGLDAAGENFLRGSFRKAIPAFTNGSAPLLFHHDGSRVLGRVLELAEDDYGLKIRARVDRQEPTSPLRYLYDAIRRGSIKGLSCGGYFQRAQTAAGQMIGQVLRLTEVSATSTAQHPLTAFQAAEVKAIMGRPATLENAEHRFALLQARAVAHEADLEARATTTAAARARLNLY